MTEYRVAGGLKMSGLTKYPLAVMVSTHPSSCLRHEERLTLLACLGACACLRVRLRTCLRTCLGVSLRLCLRYAPCTSRLSDSCLCLLPPTDSTLPLPTPAYYQPYIDKQARPISYPNSVYDQPRPNLCYLILPATT